MQRLFDLVISGLSILVLSPFLLPIILLLRITGEGEVFFSQDRMGKGGPLFSLHKFATMLKNSPNIGSGTLTVQNDPRILPLGSFLKLKKMLCSLLLTVQNFDLILCNQLTKFGIWCTFW